MSAILCISLKTMKPEPLPPAAIVCLGNFDGLHVAHRELLENAKKLRLHCLPNAACGVFCFSELSSDHLSNMPPAHLCTLQQKLELFASCGMEYAFIAEFPEIKNLSPAEFATEILQKQCNCAGIVCGFNFRFGKDGKGTPELLEELLHCPVSIQQKVTVGGKTVSSTYIRQLLFEGNAEEAAKLLARPYSFSAPVLHGKHLGTQLGTPTINQRIPQKMLAPLRGVYVTECEVDDKSFRAVTNVGLRPTVEENALVNCESFLLDFSGDLYHKTVRISFLKYLRPEIRFSSQEELREQIERDAAAARAYSPL